MSRDNGIMVFGSKSSCMFYDHVGGLTYSFATNFQCNTEEILTSIGYKPTFGYCFGSRDGTIPHLPHRRFEMKHLKLLQTSYAVKIRAKLYEDPKTQNRVPHQVLDTWFMDCHNRFVGFPPTNESKEEYTKLKTHMRSTIWSCKSRKGQTRKMFPYGNFVIHNCPPNLNHEKLEELEQIALEFENRHFREALDLIEGSKSLKIAELENKKFLEALGLIETSTSLNGTSS